MKTAWTDPVFQEPWPFFNNRVVGELYVGLAPFVPPHTVSPFTPNVQKAVEKALVRTINECRRRGVQYAEEVARKNLDEAANEVAQVIRRNPFHLSALGEGHETEQGGV